jgi:hypothetical protein
MTMPERSPEKDSADTAMLDTALDYLERGFHVIPLGDPFSPIPKRIVEEAGGDEIKARQAFCKKARIQWQAYQERQPSEAEVQRWWAQWPRANIGFITGVGINVVDGDTPEACDFLQSGAITRTPWRVKTPRGHHFYYRVNDKLVLRNSAANGLDVRGGGGYVVAPGSLSVSAEGALLSYSWQVDEAWGADDPRELPMLTGEDVAAIYTWRGASTPTNETGDPVQGEILGHLGAVREPHDGRPAAVGGRNNALASLVGQWINKGASLSEILAKARVWNGANNPPLADAELIQTVTSIVMGHQKRHGQAVPLEPVVSTATLGGLQVLSVGELQDTPPAEPETFWRRGVLFRGARFLIAGAPKAGKSQFMLALGVAAAHGGMFLGHAIEKPLRVMWVQAEIHIAFVHERIARLTNHLQGEARELVRKNLLVTGRVDLDLTNDNDFALIAQAVEDKRPDIVIFDPVINFSSADENDNGQVRTLLRRIDALGEKFGCAMALVHHTRKNVAAGDFEGVRGASAFRGWFDTGVMLSGEGIDQMIAFQVRNTEPLPPSGIFFDVEQGTYSLTEIGPTEAPETVPGRSTHRRAGQDQGSTSSTREHDPIVWEGRIATAYQLLLSNPQGLMSGELVDRFMKVMNLKERQAKTLVGMLREDSRFVVRDAGRHVIYSASRSMTGGQNYD